jgi:hypothetical protein
MGLGTHVTVPDKSFHGSELPNEFGLTSSDLCIQNLGAYGARTRNLRRDRAAL